MTRSPTHGFLTACLVAGLTAAAPALAQSGPRGELAFDGAARTGADTRAVRFRFACTPNEGPNISGALTVSLEIPRHQQLKPVFDFDRFEGPDAAGGAQSQLHANGVRNKAANFFTANGSVRGDGARGSFVFEVSASRRDAAELGRLAALLRPLMDGPGQFIWRQGSGKANAPVIAASVDLPQERAGQLKAALGPCVASR